MTANSFEEGLMIGSLLCGGNSGKEPVIKALSVTENGVYTPPSGVDGYAPVSVLVSDRYDEGYQDGYDDGYDDGHNDAKNIYEKIIGQLQGDGEDVTDDNGNPIDNAIVADNNDELEDLLGAVVFGSDGGEVEVHGLTGADCTFKITCEKEEKILSNGTTQIKTTPKLTAKNLLTGEEITFIIGNKNYVATLPDVITFKVSDVSFSTNNKAVQVTVQWYKNGEPLAGGTSSVSATNVGGTSFGSNDTQWAMIQQ